MVGSLEELDQVVVATRDGTPVLIRDVAETGFGSAPRYGALTRNGEGEAVGGLVLMLKGANSYRVTHAVKDRMAEIEKSLPKGRSEEHTSELQSLMRISYAVFCL